MASLIRAIVRYGPRLVYNPTADLQMVAEHLSIRTGLHKSEVVMVLLELHEAILHFSRTGTPVYLEGVGRFAPTMSLDGSVRIRYLPDKVLRGDVNSPGWYRGRIHNADGVGLTPAEIKELWDAEHPEDPLDLPQAA